MSKKKLSKLLHGNGLTHEEDESGNFASSGNILSFIRKMSLDMHDRVTALRPANSLIVNHRCLRPHGIIQNGSISLQVPFYKLSESVLQDIVTMVNHSQRLLRRDEGFVLLADSEDTVNILNASSFRHWWFDTVSSACRTVSEFPFTAFCFVAPPSKVLEDDLSSVVCGPNSCRQTAEIICRILWVFADLSNNAKCDFQDLLFHVLKNEKALSNGFLTANYNSRHITVCCGLYFYRLDVLDEDGFIIPPEVIAERLWAVKTHADRTERTLYQKTLLPDALEDFVSFYRLLGSLTEIDKVDCSAIMERLKNADPVNATSLAEIDKGIFTVILRGLENSNAASARWYRSSLVLEEEESAGVFRLRAHSIIIQGEMLMEFLTRVILTELTHEMFVSNSLTGSIWATNEEKEVKEEEKNGTFTGDDNNLTSGVEHLDMWLPWKHRKIIRPYAKPPPSPSIYIFSISHNNHISFTCLCLSAVLSVQQLLTAPDEFPSVLVAFQSVQGGLSAALLYSAEVEAFIQGLRCGSALVDQRTIRQLAERAMESLGGIIDACFQEVNPMYSFAKMLLDKKKAVAGGSVADNAFLGTVDFCITIGMLGISENMLECETNLLLPSRFALMCSAMSVAPQRRSAKWGPSGANVVRASLKVFSERGETSSVGEQLTECITEQSLQLLSLLSNVRF